MFTLTEREAFDAMRLFLDRFYAQAGDDLVTLIAGISRPPARHGQRI